MSRPETRLLLLTPVLGEVEPFLPAFAAALGGGAVEAALARLEVADERTLVNRIKVLAATAGKTGTALVVAVPGFAGLATVAVRGGADGVHAGEDGDLRSLRDALKGERILGAGGLRTKHDAMTAGEAGVDYVMFGEPRPDGWVPEPDRTIERAAWWAEIFETPCVAVAGAPEDVGAMAGTGAEFVGLGDLVWSAEGGPERAVRMAEAALRRPLGAVPA